MKQPQQSVMNAKYAMACSLIFAALVSHACALKSEDTEICQPFAAPSPLPKATDDDYLQVLRKLSSTGNLTDHAIDYDLHLNKYRGTRDGNKDPLRLDIQKVIDHLKRIGLAKQYQNLPILHIAGTKGKGSTSAMLESILRQAGYTTGLFTSPHLLDVRERIQLNGRPVDRDLFVSTFNRVYGALEGHEPKPEFFRILVTMALDIFLKANVDVAILEVGVGGTLSETNIFPTPIACGVTSIGLDHQGALGDTLMEIATAKAGIFKTSRPAITVPQHPEAMEALHLYAQDINADFNVTTPLDHYYLEGEAAVKASTLQLGIAGDHQYNNAALAVALAKEYDTWYTNNNPTSSQQAADRLRLLDSGVLPAAYAKGLQSVSMVGRSHIVHDSRYLTSYSNTSRVTYYMDGAHTVESLEACAKWFVKASSRNAAVHNRKLKRVMFFTGARGRDVETLLESLNQALYQQDALPDVAMFVPANSGYGQLLHAKGLDYDIDLSRYHFMGNTWRNLTANYTAGKPGDSSTPSAPGSNATAPSIGVVPHVRHAVQWLRTWTDQDQSVDIEVLVTGSFYLVSDTLRSLENVEGKCSSDLAPKRMWGGTTQLLQRMFEPLTTLLNLKPFSF